MGDPTNRIELIKAMVLCWSTIISDNFPNKDIAQVEALKQNLKVAAKALANSVDDEVDMIGEIQPLISTDRDLAELFDLKLATDSNCDRLDDPVV